MGFRVAFYDVSGVPAIWFPWFASQFHGPHWIRSHLVASRYQNLINIPGRICPRIFSFHPTADDTQSIDYLYAGLLILKSIGLNWHVQVLLHKWSVDSSQYQLHHLIREREERRHSEREPYDYMSPSIRHKDKRLKVYKHESRLMLICHTVCLSLKGEGEMM